MSLFSPMKKGFGSQVILTASSSGFIFALGFFTSMLIARLLGPVGRGELAAVQLWGTFFGALALVGITEAVVYFVGKEPLLAKEYILNGVVLSLLVGLPITVFSVFLIPVLLYEQRTIIIILAQWFLFWQFLLYVSHGIAMGGLRGLQRFDIYNFLRPLPTIGWLTVLVGAYLFGVADVELLTIAMIVSNLISSLVGLYLIKRAVPGKLRLNVKLWQPLLKFGLPTVFSMLPNYLVQYGRVSQLIVAAVLSPEDLGLIVVAISWSSITGIVPQSVGQVIFPRVAALEEGDGRQAEAARASRLTLLLSTITSLGFILISPLVIPFIYGTEFAPAVVPALIMLVTAVPAALRKVSGDTLRGLNRPQVALLGELISLGTTVIFMLILIQPLGITGVALALLISEVISAGVILVLLSRTSQIALARLLMPTAQDIQAVMAFAARIRHAKTSY